MRRRLNQYLKPAGAHEGEGKMSSGTDPSFCDNTAGPIDDGGDRLS